MDVRVLHQASALDVLPLALFCLQLLMTIKP